MTFAFVSIAFFTYVKNAYYLFDVSKVLTNFSFGEKTNFNFGVFAPKNDAFFISEK